MGLFGMGKNNQQAETMSKLNAFTQDTKVQMSYKNYALTLCISRLANAIALCEFQTFVKHEQEKNNMWWLFNIEPNKNQNKVEFWHDVIYKMVYDENGALIVQDKQGNLVVAEDYTVKEFATQENIYTNIKLKGNEKVDGAKRESEVVRLVLGNGKVRQIVDSVYDDYGKILEGTIRFYKRNNASKKILKIDAQFAAMEKERVVLEDGTETNRYKAILDNVMHNRFANIFSEKDVVIPIENGLELVDLPGGKGNTSSGAANTRDITETFTDILHFTADAFGIPRGYIKGDVADVANMKKNFVDDAIKPLGVIIETEFNRKMYRMKNYQNGTKMKVQTNSMFTKDIVELAASAEAMYRVGVMNADEVREKLGEEPIGTQQSQEYYVTKNYQNVDSTKGGGEDEQGIGKNSEQE